MDLNNTIDRLNNLIDYKDADKKFLLSLYKSLFDKINPNNNNEFESVLEISDKLISHFLNSHDYNSVLKIYKIEHSFFYRQFEDEYADKLNEVIKNATISESGLKDILDYLLVSFDVIKLRWNKVIDNLKKLESDEVNSIIEKQMKPLLFKSNFHIIHSVHFIKHNYQELEKVYQKINELSLIDSLTGLKNRRYFFMTYENLFFMANRRKIPICFVMMDIDNFKRINDAYGHQKGDEVLIKIALLISNFFRRSDMIIRYGGDEILVMLTDANSYDVKILIEQLLKKISSVKFKNEESTFSVTMSVGISCEKIDNCIKPAIMKNKLIKHADIAMYQSKNNGKNRVTVYEENNN